MDYEKTGKKVNKDSARNATYSALKNVNTGTLLWAIITRHKFGLVSTWAIVVTVLYIFPPAPDLLLSFLR